MEITMSNFAKEYENIKNNLKRSCFIGFDAEFTGLLAGENFKNRLFDTNEERYNLLKNEIHKIIINQVGLTIFEYDRNTDMYLASGYTFHLGPQVVGNIDQSFTFNASSLNFLCKHNFDFNKFIYKGIHYLSKADEKRLQDHMDDESFVDFLYEGLEIDDEELLQAHFSDVSKWLTEGEEGTMYIDVDNPIIRYMLHVEIRSRFPETLTTNSLSDSQKLLIYKNKTIDGAFCIPSSELKENLIGALKGFSNIISLLEEYQKPMIGHNILLDVVLFHNQFIGPLPSKYNTFKRNVNKVFPHFYDTKHISNVMGKQFLSYDEVWKTNTLRDLFEFFKEAKCPRLEKDRNIVTITKPFTLNQTYHEAGWDSYCAGYCFVRLGHWMAAEMSGRSKPVGPTEMLSALAPYRNKVNVIRGATHYMNLTEDDPPRHRPDLLHVRAMKERVIDVAKMASVLSNFGSVDVKPYGARAALVAVSSSVVAQRILKKFRESPEYRISLYNARRHSTLGRVTVWQGHLYVWAHWASDEGSAIYGAPYFLHLFRASIPLTDCNTMN